MHKQNKKQFTFSVLCSFHQCKLICDKFSSAILKLPSQHLQYSLQNFVCELPGTLLVIQTEGSITKQNANYCNPLSVRQHKHVLREIGGKWIPDFKSCFKNTCLHAWKSVKSLFVLVCLSFDITHAFCYSIW